MMVKKLCIIAWRKWWNTGTHVEPEIEREEKVSNIKNLVTFVPCETHVIKAKVIKVKCRVVFVGQVVFVTCIN
jgi:hypothetical protein